MTAPAPKPSKAGELLLQTAVKLADYRMYSEMQDAEVMAQYRSDVVEAVKTLESMLFTPEALQSTMPLMPETMGDLHNFMMFVAGDAKDILDEEVVAHLKVRYADIAKWQKALREAREREELAAFVRDSGS